MNPPTVAVVPTTPTAPPRSPAQRLGAALVSPRGILLVIPLLVALAGLANLITGSAILTRSLDELVRVRFADQADHLADLVRTGLVRAQTKLAWFHAFLDEQGAVVDRGALARHLQRAMKENPSIAYMSLSRADGTFQAVLRRQEDGTLRWQESSPPSATATGQDQLFALDAQGGIGAGEAPTATAYDPRQRPFYILAQQRRARIWTEPYLFYRSAVTGVSCAEPWYAADGGLRGVLTIDFDLDSMSRGLAALHNLPDSRTALFQRSGALLAGAGPGMQPPPRAGVAGTNRALASLGDCPDPLARELLVQVISQGADQPGARLAGVLQHPQDGQVLYDIVPCPVGDEQLWYLGSYAPREALLGPVKELRARGLGIALASVLLAGALASAFARHVVRTEQAHAAARRAARAAESRADDLGAYRLLKKLGEGGMGEVWRAEHRQLARPAAIKLIRAQLGGADASSEHVQRFEREAQAIASLRSSHTIDLYDFGVAADGGLFYVMELLDGLDLDDLVARFGPQPAGRVVEIVAQICSSLGEAHARGLIHRDIKPANVYLCRQADEVDVVKVLDFGLVLANEKVTGQERLTNSGLVHGTPSYMAPEQAQGDALDGRADLYALGCVAYWLLTGETVFADKGTMQQLISHVERPPRPIAEVVRSPLPPGLAEIIMGCLAKDPSERPQDAYALAAALRGVVCTGPQAWTGAAAQRWWTANVPLADFSRPINPDALSMRRR